MIKSDELTQGCMSKALDDEMTFTLLSRDIAAPAAIREWCNERIRLGRNKADNHQIIEAQICANAMERQRDEIREKLSKSQMGCVDPRRLDEREELLGLLKYRLAGWGDCELADAIQKAGFRKYK